MPISAEPLNVFLARFFGKKTDKKEAKRVANYAEAKKAVKR
jgi:hypothetical protein